MDIKLLAIDMDDTLISDDLIISDRDKTAIRRAREIGVKPFMCTGRPFLGIERYFDELDVEPLAICFGGAEIYDSKGNTILKHFAIDVDTAKEVIAFARECGCHIQAYRDDGFVCEQINKYSDLYVRLSNLNPIVLENMLECINWESPKLLMISEEDKVPDIIKLAQERFGDKLHISGSRRDFIEIVKPGVTKGNALKYLTEEYYGFMPENVMAIGDGFIDRDMLLYAGIGVAMANAVPSVLEIADYITADNNNSGVAKAIEKFVFGGENA